MRISSFSVSLLICGGISSSYDWQIGNITLRKGGDTNINGAQANSVIDHESSWKMVMQPFARCKCNHIVQSIEALP